MTRLKRLIILSAVVLFTILVFILTGYFKRVDIIDRKERAEEGFFLSANQQVLAQQLARKASVLRIHHYFSEGQYQQQVKETDQLQEAIKFQQTSLFNILTNGSIPPKQAAPMIVDFQKGDSAFHLMQLFIQEEKKAGGTEQDYERAALLRSYESSFLLFLQNLGNQLRQEEKRLQGEHVILGNLMLASLVIGLFLLITVIILPALKLNSQTYEELQASLARIKNAQKAIEDSELKYRRLFQLNPMPMWIFDAETLRFLEVNERMLEHYGYNRQELESMTCLDIRPDREKERLQKILPTYTSKDELYSAGNWIHKKKNGEEFIVDIMTCMLDYGGKEAMLVLANDVTRNLELQDELMNSKLAHQREVAKASLSVQEKERTDIGKELHDNVNQILTSVKLHLEMINSDKEAVHLSKSIDGVKTAIDEIRRLSKSLVPPTFNDMGLIGAIDDLVENMNLYCPISIKFLHYDFDENGYSDDLKLTLFRIVQEQLTNVVKHSEASEVLVQLNNDNGNIGLVIDDNGKGCDKGKKRNGIGINNIINRADMFGGEVTIETQPGSGFRLEVNFPVQELQAQSLSLGQS